MKRSRDSLTGGTRDVSPQFYTFTASQSAADTTTTTQIPIPVEKLSSSTNPTIIEVLKMFFWLDNNVVEADNEIQIYVSTKSSGTTNTNYSDATVFAGYQRQWFITTSGGALVTQPVIQDLTDGAGHGVLIGTDNIYVQIRSGSTSLANTVRIKMLYRFKRVGLAEYIGIVQSQQS